MRFFVIWLFAFLGVGIALITLYHSTTNSRVPDKVTMEGDIIFIGSSLMQYAVPSGRLSLSSGSQHYIVRRYSLSGISEQESFDLMAIAVERPETRMILLEINPIALSFEKRRADISFMSPAIAKKYIDIRSKVGRAANSLIRVNKIDLQFDPPGKDVQHLFSEAYFANKYPFKFVEPVDPSRIERLIGKAKARDIEIVFLSFPRAVSAAKFLGDQFTDDANIHLEKLAKRYDVRFFNPATSWPDQYFLDEAHFSRTGRARYLDELSKWFENNL